MLLFHYDIVEGNLFFFFFNKNAIIHSSEKRKYAVTLSSLLAAIIHQYAP